MKKQGDLTACVLPLLRCHVTSRDQIVEDNLKALESLAMVGLVPKVMTILETRGAWEEKEENWRGGAQAGVAADGSLLVSPAVEVEASETKQQEEERRSGGGPKVRISCNCELRLSSSP